MDLRGHGLSEDEDDGGVDPGKPGQPPPDEQEAGLPCSWWRRGRVELGLKHGLVVISWLENPRFTTRNEHRGAVSGSR